jgi:CheY-like chemotaxis protein
MKKVLLANNVKEFLSGKVSFLDRADIAVYTAASNAELLKIHREEEADLIVTVLDMPGVRSEEVFRVIRQNAELRQVSVIIIGEDTLANRERLKKCGANDVFTHPVDLARLHLRMQQLLHVAPRMSYRAPLAVAIQGSFKDRPLPFRTENISASGMLLKTGEPLSAGDGIFFSFFLPKGAHVSGYGEIVRITQPQPGQDGFCYGIRYTNIDPGDRSEIEAAVKKSPP